MKVLKCWNRAAEDAVKEATYICGCGDNMSFADARGILMGNETATNYLQNSTSTALYGKFNLIIKKPFTKEG
jgi:hypothetical protein